MTVAYRFARSGPNSSGAALRLMVRLKPLPLDRRLPG
jgi:hypothetical protein